MTDEDLITVLFLPGVCPVDVVTEGSLDPGSILVILLGAEQGIVSVEGAGIGAGPQGRDSLAAAQGLEGCSLGGVFTTASGFQ